MASLAISSQMEEPHQILPFRESLALPLMCIYSICRDLNVTSLDTIRRKRTDTPMAEPRSPSSSSPESRAVQVFSCSTSTEPAPPGSSDLQPISLGSVSSPSSLSSAMIPVRLDVLYFLLSSAFKGAQHGFPTVPVHCGPGALATCRGPAPQLAPSCCGCHSACHGMVGCAPLQQSTGVQQQSAGLPQQPAGIQQQGGPLVGYGWPSPGVTDGRNHRFGWGGNLQQSSGDSWSGASQPSSAGHWRRGQSSADWQENPRKEGGGGGGREGRGQGGRDHWQGKRPNFQRSWGHHRHGAADSAPRKPGSQDSGREASSFGSNSGNGKRGQECSPWQALRGGPDAKKRPDGSGTRWSSAAVGRTAGATQAKTGGQEGEEDWEAEYESGGSAAPPAPRILPLPPPNDQAGLPKAGEGWDEGCSPPAALPKPRLAISLLPESATKDLGAAATGETPAASPLDQSRSDGLASDLRSLCADPPGKSSSEGSSNLVIDTDVESLKPEEDELS
ncbi:hypothetical protein lerEdw1_009631 [Lerista edwardsae]|nr:hypothetical protein lerEdw1_009631 [Lerista edwardsae]